MKFGNGFAGQWAQKVMHPSSGLTKEYNVTVDRPATRKHLQQVLLLPPISSVPPPDLPSQLWTNLVSCADLCQSQFSADVMCQRDLQVSLYRCVFGFGDASVSLA